MLNYISTRNAAIKASPSRAILDGLAPDGGLYVPEDLKALELDYRKVIAQDYRGMAKTIFARFFPDFGEETIARIVTRSCENKFADEAITPLVKVGKSHVLELFHGPTCAFKDVALSALPNLMTEAAERNAFHDEILILTATSGDTGSAALHGFSDVPGTRIITFFPEGGISETQRLQMVTQRGSNTCAVAVKGNFDDAQSGVKRLFREIPKPQPGISLSSANSINIGRLVPQVVYYFAAYKALLEAGEIAAGDLVDFAVPTGNFGDIMAGYFAGRMGLPVGRLLCASNRNDVLTEFLETGHYDRARSFYKTTSPSMDILVSSNLERLLYFVAGAEKTAEYMRRLAEDGEYTISAEELAEIRRRFVGISCDDEEGSRAIGTLFREEGYLMDTHTAIAWAAQAKAEASGRKSVVLSTASPYKFTRAVLSALGEAPLESDRDNMMRLSLLTGTAVPAPLRDIFAREIVHRDGIEVSEMKAYVTAKAGEMPKGGVRRGR